MKPPSPLGDGLLGVSNSITTQLFQFVRYWACHWMPYPLFEFRRRAGLEEDPFRTGWLFTAAQLLLALLGQAATTPLPPPYPEFLVPNLENTALRLAKFLVGPKHADLYSDRWVHYFQSCG